MAPPLAVKCIFTLPWRALEGEGKKNVSSSKRETKPLRAGMMPAWPHQRRLGSRLLDIKSIRKIESGDFD
jgi:hypothetical protein